ncbi:hypothetical protein BC832DRAFT_548241 [Gaertneriomyces semiglobifer]|nr:hypothetical protein BC832DRAFT_548241 [Gaertneriomyces semiglobifer]
MGPEQLMATKMEIMKPYRRRNAMLGGALIAGVAAVFVYSMYKTGTDEFDNIPMPPPPAVPESTKSRQG